MSDLSTSPLIPMLRKLEHSGVLSDPDREALLALPHILKTIEPRHFTTREGDMPTHSCLLRSGFMYRHKILGDGGRQILSIHMAGDMVDTQGWAVRQADHNVQALTRAEVAFIPQGAIQRLAFERPGIGERIWHDSLVDASIFREWIANIGRRDSKTRLAHLLCEFALRLEGAGLSPSSSWVLPMTQEQLADCTGMTAVHVNRSLRALGEQGLIHRTKRSVTIDDWKRLAAAGDFESSYLHMGEDRLGMVQ
jgi:CRP-like cAMP-binding protein